MRRLNRASEFSGFVSWFQDLFGPELMQERPSCGEGLCEKAAKWLTTVEGLMFIGEFFELWDLSKLTGSLALE